MIRSARSDDIPSFIALQRRVELDEEIWGYAADSEDAWSARGLAWTFVATGPNHEIVGFIHCAPRTLAGECVFPAGGRVLEILELVVEREHRDLGHGHALVGHARHEASTAGFSHLRVYSAAKRFDDMVRFYRSCGFTPWYLELTQPLGS